MLMLHNIAYLHPSAESLFENIHLTLNVHEKIAIIGNNGSGKSTLLKIIAGIIPPSNGELKLNAPPYLVPQIFGQYNHLTIAEAIGIDKKLQALKSILNGQVTEANFNLLNDDWTIEERCMEALNFWQLAGLDLTQKMKTLSGGEKTKVYLAGISIHQSKLVLLDEPSNHLDTTGRELLYKFIQSSAATLIVVSHDRKLLNLLDNVCELGNHGLKVYGGNYDFYTSQKQIENEALEQDIKNKEKALRKAKDKERETLERQQKLDSRGKQKQEKSGVAKIMMNTLRNNAEQSMAKLKEVHDDKRSGIAQELQALRNGLPAIDKMKFGFDDMDLHTGKILFTASAINYQYDHHFLWKENLDLEITSGERIALKGNNGSGKTTLIKIILGELLPVTGTVYKADYKSVYIDQDYSLIKNQLKVYEQAQCFNNAGLLEHEIKIRLTRFLFTKDDWDKSCGVLSGGEKMRLMLCCLTINTQSPGIIIMDEPTNNLDIQNIKILTEAINIYHGTLVVVSHDEYFLQQVGIKRVIRL